MFDGEAFGAEIVDVVRGYVDRTLAPVIARMDALEKSLGAIPAQPDQLMMLAAIKDEVAAAARALTPPEPPVTRDDVKAIVVETAADAVMPGVFERMNSFEKAMAEAATAANEAMIAKAVQALPPAPAGKDADPETIKQMVADAVAALPPPEPGKDADQEQIERAVAAAVAALPKPQDGKSVTLDDVRPLIQDEIKAAVASLPPAEPGQPGKSVTMDDVAPIIDAAVEKRIAAIPQAKDGVGLAGALIDRSGDLTLTLTDGSLRNLGPVVGKDADVSAAVAEIKAAVAMIPAPRDGKDGLGFDDLIVDYDGERGIVLRFERGEQTKAFPLRLPIPIDRGVYKADTAYERGDTVTWGGSVWIAQEDTSDKPETTRAWRLAVKKGRDGKDRAG